MSNTTISRIREIQALLPGTVHLDDFFQLCDEQADLILSEKPNMTNEEFIELGEQMIVQSYDRLTDVLYAHNGLSSFEMVNNIAPTQRKFAKIRNLIDQMRR